MIYVNITSTFLYKLRTGIQRVVVKIGNIMMSNDAYQFIMYDHNSMTFKRIIPLKDLESAIYDDACQLTDISYDDFVEGDMFFDMDAAWSDRVDRNVLYPLLKKRNIKIINLHHDSVPIINASWSNVNTVIPFIQAFYAKIAYSDYIFSTSQFVKDEIDALAEKYLGITPAGEVIQLGPMSMNSSSKIALDLKHEKSFKSILSRPFILAVGTLEPRKNYPLLLQAFNDAKLANHHLVIVGKKGWKIDDFISQLEGDKHYNQTIFWLKGVTDEELLFLYRCSFLYVTTSWYEGYGLPAIEALALGVPSIVSNGGALPEVVGEAAAIFDLSHPNTLVELLQKATKDSDFYQELKTRCQRLKTYSWDEVTLTVTNALEKLDNSAVTYDFDTPVQQIVYISICVDKFKLSLSSVKEKMPFIQNVAVLTKGVYAKAYEKVITELGLKGCVFSDEELLSKDELNTSDHVERNTLLRRKLYQTEEIECNFIASDDDAVVLNLLDSSYYQDGSVHSAFYYYEDLYSWMGSFPNRTSYDNGILKTARMLTQYGYPRRSYSSHMPQIFNKKLVNQIYSTYLKTKEYSGVDEWSTYFNIAKFMFPKNILIKKYRCYSWPGNSSDWINDVIPDSFDFQNYYDDPKHGSTVIIDDTKRDTLPKYRESLVVSKQREVGEEGKYNAPFYLTMAGDNILFSQSEYILQRGPPYFRRFIIINKQIALTEQTLKISIRSSTGKLVRQFTHYLKDSLGFPLSIAESAGLYTLECELHEENNILCSVQTTIKVV